MITQQRRLRQFKLPIPSPARVTLTMMGLVGLVTSCHTALAQGNQRGAPVEPSARQVAPTFPTLMPTVTPFMPQELVGAITTSTLNPTPTATFWPVPTPWSTPTPWPTPVAWKPALPVLPTLAPIAVVPTALVRPEGSLPISYSPPDGVDVFGSTILRWTYYGYLAEDEFFDIKIKPAGSNNSVFVGWSKSPEYTLQPWSGWSPGLYTWQIGIIKGYLEGETKHFIADTGRDSQPFLIKWQAGGGGGGGGGVNGGGGGGSSGGS